MKVLIAGAGPSGLTLCSELIRRGIDCSIIDKASGPAPLHESRALAFNARSYSILGPSGVGDQIVAAGHNIERVNVCWQGELRKSVTFAAASPKLTTIRQGQIERLLMQHINSQGTEVRWGTELLDFTQSDSTITAQLKLNDGTEISETASLLIGCDGAHSRVRQQGGYSFTGERDSQTWTLADVKLLDDGYAHTVTADLRHGRAFATLPLGNNIVRLIHNGADILKTHPVAQSDNITDTYWESEFNVSYRMVRLFHRGRTFLCGDAAHIHSPVGGRGMNLGIEDAATLAWLLEHGRQAEYTAMRIPIAKKILRQTRNQTRQMHSDSRLSSLAKKYGPKALSLTPIRQMLLNSMLGLDTPAPPWLE